MLTTDFLAPVNRRQNLMIEIYNYLRQRQCRMFGSSNYISNFFCLRINIKYSQDWISNSKWNTPRKHQSNHACYSFKKSRQQRSKADFETEANASQHFIVIILHCHLKSVRALRMPQTISYVD